MVKNLVKNEMLVVLLVLSFLTVTFCDTSPCKQYNGQCGSSDFQIKVFISYFWEKLDILMSWNQDLASRARTGKTPTGYWGYKYGRRFTNPGRTSLKEKMITILDNFKGIYKYIDRLPDGADIGCACTCSPDETIVEIGCFFPNR
ncbi:hypothetical protein OSTOST_06991 [Ostertagia ostertagi]